MGNRMMPGPVEETVTVSVRLPARLFSKLADLGELLDMRVDELLIEIGAQHLTRKAPTLSDPVVSRWREGWTDKQIAADLGWTNSQVSDRRRRVGLPANSRKSPGWKVRAHKGDAA